MGTSGITIPPFPLLLYLVVLMFVGVLLAGLCALGFGAIWGLEYQFVLQSFSAESTIKERNFVRWVAVFSQIFTFLLPAVALTVIFFKGQWRSFLGFDHKAAAKWLLAGVVLMLISIPFVQFLYWVNQQIPLPDWMIGMESNTEALIRNMLITERSYELWFNLILIGLLPAVGEELFFRGIVQPQLGRLVKNPVLGIWLAAFVFSAIHFQFEGFFARLWLGALLGYLYYWTRSIWAPILAHFANNASQVLLIFLYSKNLTDLNIEDETPYPWDLTVISLVLTLVLGYFIWKAHQRPGAPENFPKELSEETGSA